MSFKDYAEVRLGLEHRIVETYEESRLKVAELDLERRQLLGLLVENNAKLKQVYADAERLVRELRRDIAHLEADYNRKEVCHG